MATAIQTQVSIAGGLYEFADSYDARTPTFRDRLAAPARIERRLPDLFQGLQTRQEARIRVKNVALWTPSPAGTVPVGEEATTEDVTASDILAGSEGLAGKSAAVVLYCLDSSAEIARLDGVIVDAREAAGGATGMEEGEITINALNLDALQQLVPRVRLLDRFPNADVADLSGSDLPVVVLFGQARKLRLAYLGVFSGKYCFGAVRTASGITWDAVYRDKAVVDASEYTVLTINGCAVIGFARDQIDGSGRRFVIQADVTGTEFTRPSDAGKFLLNDVTYGLGLPVNAASFTAAAAAYAAVSYNVGGGLTQRVQAQVVLNKLALRGAIIQRNGAGEYTWTVDEASVHTASPVKLGRGDGYWENIDRVLGKSHKRIEERVKKIVLQGLLDNGFDGSPTYLLTAQRTRAALTGAELPPEQNEWIEDATTLDRETDYRFKALIEGERELAVTVEVGDAETPCGRVLALNQVVPVLIPNLRLDETTGEWMIAELAVDARGVDVTLRGYNAAIYTYTPGTVQSAPSVTYQPDYTFTLPDAPAGFGVLSSTIVTASDGGKSVIATLEADAPTVNVSHLVFQIFRDTSVIPVWQRQITVTKGQQNVQAAFHLPVGEDADNTYDLQCFARNVANAVGFQDGLVAQVLNWTPGTDTIDPSAPTGLTAAIGTGKLVTLSWTANPVVEGVQRYGVYRHPTNTPASATLIATEDSTTYIDATVVIGSTYYYWVTAIDRFENESVKSTVAGPVTPTGIPPDTTPPSNPGALTFSSQTTYQGSDGTWFASISFTVPAMPSGAVVMNGLFRRDGTTPWLVSNQVTSGGGTVTFDALASGLFYDFALVAYSAYGITSAVVQATGNPRFAPSDVTAPAVPTGLAATVGTGQVVSLNWDDNTELDRREYRVYRGLANPPTAIIAEVAASRFVDISVTIGTQYFYAVSARDRDENESEKSTVISATPVLIPGTHTSNTVPNTPSVPVFSSEGTYQSSDGMTFAFIEVTAPAMPTNGVAMNMLYRPSGATAWSLADQVSAGGVESRVDDLVPGRNYQFAVVALSVFGRASAVSAVLSRAAPADAVAPGVPSVTGVEVYNYRMLSVRWDPVGAGDLSEYRIYRAALQNLVLNYGFEMLGFEDWLLGGTPGGGESVTQTTTLRHSGAYALRINAAGTGGFLEYQDITVTSGATYTLCGWGRLTAWTAGQLLLRAVHGASSSTALALSAVGGWEFGSVTFVAAATTVRIECRATVASTFTGFFDDIILVAGTPNPNILVGEVRTSHFIDTGLFAEGFAQFFSVSSLDHTENESTKSAYAGVTPVRIPNEDLPNNAPLALTGLAVSSSGTYQSTDGTTLAFVVFTWSNPTDTKRAFVEVAYRRNGNSTSYLIADQVLGATARIDDLTPGLGYDYRVRGCSHTGYFGTASTLTNQVAPGDTTAPAQVTGLTLSDHPPRGVLARWTAVTADDLANYEIQTATDSGFTTALVTRTAKTTELPLTGLTNGTTYFVRVRAKDLTGNNGVFSTTVNRSVPRNGTDDHGDGTITDVKVASLSAVKITTGLLTVNPSTGGATAIYVTNAGKIRFRSNDTAPSQIIFEDDSLIERVAVSANSAGLRILPVTNGTLGLTLGSSLSKFQNVLTQSSQQTQIISDGAVIINAGDGIRLFGQIRTDQVVSSAPGGTLNKYINVYTTGGTFQGRIAVYS